MLLDAPGTRLRDATSTSPGPVRRPVAPRRSGGVCRTDLARRRRRAARAEAAAVLGHEIVGTVVTAGAQANVALGTRVGVPWLGWTCGRCDFAAERENLCADARSPATSSTAVCPGRTRDHRLLLPHPGRVHPGARRPAPVRRLIGQRCLPWRVTHADSALYGFGAAAHIVTQIARHEGREVFASSVPATATRNASRATSGDLAGDGRDTPPAPLDAASSSPPSARWCRWAEGHRPRWHRRVRRHPHERRAVVPVRAPVGRARPRSVANLTVATRRRSRARARGACARTSRHPTRSGQTRTRRLRHGPRRAWPARPVTALSARCVDSASAVRASRFSG